MSLSIANNVSALNARNNLNRASSMLSKSIERLSSGFKVNRGADGPAALVISEKQRAQISGLRAAIDNTEKAVSVVQTAEGALNEINSLLVKIRSLAIDSANTGVNDDDALAANQAEIDNALDTISRIANNTQFGQKKLLDGTVGIQGVTTDTDVTFINATSDTSAGSYEVNITQAGGRANTTATAQTGDLAVDEILTVNGVSISLNAGLSRAEVQARINEFSGQTGVVAEEVGGANASTYRGIRCQRVDSSRLEHCRRCDEFWFRYNGNQRYRSGHPGNDWWKRGHRTRQRSDRYRWCFGRCQDLARRKCNGYRFDGNGGQRSSDHHRQFNDIPNWCQPKTKPSTFQSKVLIPCRWALELPATSSPPCLISKSHPLRNHRMRWVSLTRRLMRSVTFVERWVHSKETPWNQPQVTYVRLWKTPLTRNQLSETQTLRKRFRNSPMPRYWFRPERPCCPTQTNLLS